MHSGDIIVADTSEDTDGCGNCSHVDHEMQLFAGYHTIILRALEHDDSKYIAYLMKTDPWRSQIRSRVSGVKVFSISRKILSDALVIYPPLPEQSRIAAFLDRRCAEIDRVIAATQRTIEEYKKLKQSIITEAVTHGVRGERKMKDSGVEWIGEIPEEWSVPKMGMICEVITDYVASGSFASLAENVVYIDEPDYAMLIRTADISNKGYKPKPVYINIHAYEFLHNSNLFGGELLFPNIGASVGDVYIVPKLYERMSLAPNAIMVKTKHCDKFYYYYFLSIPGRLSIEDLAQSTAQAKYNKTDFRQLRVLLPPKEEQLEIVDFLDDRCAEIDRLIESKQQLLTQLEAYKKSVIFEYVTGKKETPDEAV